MVDEKLKWDEHICYMAKKIGKVNYSLGKSTKILNKDNKKLLYS